MEMEALVAEALSNEVTVEVSPEAMGPAVSDEQTVVIVAEEERSRQEPIRFAPLAHQEPVPQDLTPIPEPEATAEDLARPIVQEPRDLEPTDK
jgi:hypothetical protein